MSAPINKPLTQAQLNRFKDYYNKSSNIHSIRHTWKSLHLVLENKNVKDKDVQFCIDFAEQHNDKEGSELGRILFTQSKSQRLSLPDKLFS